MKIGHPFKRTPRPKSSKLYDDYMSGERDTPADEPGYGAFGSLAGFVVCISAAGVFLISKGHSVVGAGLVVFGVVPAALIAAQGIALGKQLYAGTVALLPVVAESVLGEDADIRWAQANKALSRAELEAAGKSRARELESVESWLEEVHPRIGVVDLEGDGHARLVAHTLPSEGSRNWLVYAPGLGGTWKSGLAAGRRFALAGYNLMLVDPRAQGESGGSVIGAGHLDRRDLVAWCSFIAAQDPEARIVLMGASMGGAAVLEASGETGLPSQVVAVVADSAYADAWNEAIHVMGTMGANGKAMPAHPVLDFARLSFRSQRGAYDLADASAVKAVENAQVPVLLLHGDDDSDVPVYNAARIAKAARSECTVKTFPGAGHCCASLAEPGAYYDAIFEFLGR